MRIRVDRFRRVDKRAVALGDRSGNGRINFAGGFDGLHHGRFAPSFDLFASFRNFPDDDVTRYVVHSETTTTADDDSTYNYSDVTIHVDVDADGDAGTNNNHEVTAEIPEATDYKHIHFGVWAALGDPEKNGTQELSNLGIGFVQNYSGEGLTPIGGGSDDMPNGGTAEYNGNWIAAVQSRDVDGNGDITLRHGAADLTANFGKATIDVDLTGLATLTGDITGNEFEGTEAALLNDPAVAGEAADLLGADGEFMGSFSGGFYGAKAAEAGGVFDFTSEDAEAGAFRGAFGGDKD